MIERERADTSFFEANNLLAAQIEDSNKRALTIPELQDAEFEGIATEALTAEQQAVFDELRTKDQAPYERLTSSMAAAEEAVNSLKQQLDDVRETMTDEQRHYDELVVKLVSIAPLGEARAKEVADRRKNELVLSRVSALREALEAAEIDELELSDIFEVAGRPWPIPLLAVRGSQKAIEAESVVTVDEIPIDPVLRKSDQEQINRIKTRNIDAPEASAYVVFYLANKAGTVVTVDELTNFLYGHVETTSHNLRNRITTILGPKIQGLRIQDMLLKEGDGYVLQYGFRRTYDGRSRKAIGPMRRIYRALPESAIDAAQNFVINKATKEVDIFEDGQPEFDSEHIEVASPQSIPVVPVSRQPETQSTSMIETAPTNSVTAPRPERALPRWQQDLKRAIGEAINQLEADSLMGKGEINMDVASRMSSSNIFGTLTALERVEDAGVVNVGTKQRSIRKSFPLTPEVRVVMTVFNTQAAAFTERNKRKTALALVDEAVASYFRHLEERKS